jgi:hypothetical protein
MRKSKNRITPIADVRPRVVFYRSVYSIVMAKTQYAMRSTLILITDNVTLEL